MPPHVTPEQLSQLQHQARLLAAQAADHERGLQALLATAEQDMPGGSAEEGIKQAHAVNLARQLCLDAREHQVALERVVTDLGPDTAASDLSRPAIVLVADDYEDSREWLSIVLRSAGFLVRTATNGLEAVIAAHQLRPAVILMDLGMPVLDGVAATRLIKTFNELRDAHVIAYTAQPATDPRLDRDLFTAVLHKPSSPDHILAVVQRYAAASA